MAFPGRKKDLKIFLGMCGKKAGPFRRTCKVEILTAALGQLLSGIDEDIGTVISRRYVRAVINRIRVFCVKI